MKQKHFFRRLLSVLAIIALPSFSYSYEIGDTFVYDHDSGNQYTYRVTSDSTVSLIKVEGPAEFVNIGSAVGGSDYYYKDLKGYWYKVTEIGERAFATAPDVTGVLIPAAYVIKIGNSAFKDCKNLRTVDCRVNLDGSGTLTEIGESAFEGCSNLTSVFLSAGYWSSHYSGFPSSVTKIGNYAFRGCSSLTNFTIPQSLASLGDEAFSESGLISVNLKMNDIKNKYFSGSAETFSDITKGGIDDISGIVWDCSESANIASVSKAFQAGEGVVRLGTSSEIGSLTTVPLKVEKGGTVTIEIDVRGWFKDAGELLISLTGCEPQSVSYSATDGFETVTAEFKDIPESDPALTISTSKNDKRCYINEIRVDGISQERNIRKLAFSGCSSLTSIISQLNPKFITSLEEDVFKNVDKSIPLYVPASLVDEYKNADQWKEFSNILPIEDASITASVVSEDGLSTYCSPVGVDFSNATKIAAYRARVIGPTVYLTKADKVNAGEGVLLRSLNGGTAEESLPLSIDVDMDTENALNEFVGVLKQTTIYETNSTYSDNTNFVLSKVDDVVGFYKAKQNGTTVDAGKAYLPAYYNASAAIKGLTLVFEDGFATGIDIVDYVQEQASDDTYYTIGGVPVKNPTQKGVYIKGGKKYIVK